MASSCCPSASCPCSSSQVPCRPCRLLACGRCCRPTYADAVSRRRGGIERANHEQARIRGPPQIGQHRQGQEAHGPIERARRRVLGARMAVRQRLHQQQLASLGPRLRHEGLGQRATDAAPMDAGRDRHPGDLGRFGKLRGVGDEAEHLAVLLGHEAVLALEIAARLRDALLEAEPVRQPADDRLASVRVVARQGSDHPADADSQIRLSFAAKSHTSIAGGSTPSEVSAVQTWLRWSVP
jgi:hypothetical protein